ncbi:VOC family protein [Nocardiopsis potens]|uniref:VOC family protein n=1 Tax=Nocardiopsis potens TaxID=1246458 RepID=UPI000344F927|nr:VOC family protein [Nocardiopsis potens]
MRHLGFRAVADDGYAVEFLHDDPSSELVLVPGSGWESTEGAVLAFEVGDAAAEQERLRAEGVEITTPLRDEERGERLFQVTDPNGVVVQPVQWIGERPGDA